MTSTLYHHDFKKQINDAKPVNAGGVAFAKKIAGYDRKSVDRYVANLDQAYRTAYGEYQAVCDKYNKLLAQYNEYSKRKDQTVLNAERVAEMFIDAELIAQKVVSEAQVKADRIITEARDMAKKIMEDANAEKAAVQIQTQKLIENAGAETARAGERARLIVENAKAEADRIADYINQNLEQANESIAQLIIKIQDLTLLTPAQKTAREQTIEQKPVTANAAEDRTQINEEGGISNDAQDADGI